MAAEIAPSSTRPRSAGHRLWDRPLWQHAIVLALLLVVLALFTKPDRSFSSDEGAVVIQAKRLAAGNGWLRPNDFPTVDPSGTGFFYGFSLSDGGPTQWMTYGKHPTYPSILSVLDRVGGTFAMVLFSVAGAVGAALAGAGLARRLDPRIDRATLWALGVGSPLLFYSQVLLAHAVGAALVGAATLALLRARESNRWLPALAALALVGLSALFRTETLLFALAAGLVFGIVAVRARNWRMVALSVALPVVAFGGNLVDRVWYGRISGGAPMALPNTSATPNFLETRVSGAADMILLPGATWPSYVFYGLLVMLVAIVGTCFLLRRDGKGGNALRVGSAMAIVGALLPFTAGVPDTIPSILITFPIVAAGLVLLSRRELEDTEAGVLLAITLVFTAAIAATQYQQGGGAEWGARFLTLVLPLVTPVAVLAIATMGRRLPVADRKLGLVTLLVITAAMSLLSLRTLVYYKGTIDTWVDLIGRAEVGRQGPDLGNGDRRPIVVTTWSGLGRFIWPVTPEPRGLTVQPEQLRQYATALRDAGASEVIFATYDPDKDLAAFDGLYDITERIPQTSQKPPVYILRARGGS